MPNSEEPHKMTPLQPEMRHLLSVTRRLQPAGRMHIRSFRQDAQGRWMANVFILYRVLRQNCPEPGAG